MKIGKIALSTLLGTCLTLGAVVSTISAKVEAKPELATKVEAKPELAPKWKQSPS
ncbi:hypothetical protein LJK87_41845 [Paenibacillus sp. P25]|nr:hypothetical protein LJK87_41845 [Paenibacillus sp. P25]